MEKSSELSKFPSKKSLYLSPSPVSPAGSGLAAPDVTLTIRRSGRRAADVADTPDQHNQREPRDTVNESNEQKETIYESLNNFNNEFSIAKETFDSKQEVNEPEKERDNLYAKVKKLSNTYVSFTLTHLP